MTTSHMKHILSVIVREDMHKQVLNTELTSTVFLCLYLSYTSMSSENM